MEESMVEASDTHLESEPVLNGQGEGGILKLAALPTYEDRKRERDEELENLCLFPSQPMVRE